MIGSVKRCFNDTVIYEAHCMAGNGPIACSVLSSAVCSFLHFFVPYMDTEKKTG